MRRGEEGMMMRGSVCNCVVRDDDDAIEIVEVLQLMIQVRDNA